MLKSNIEEQHIKLIEECCQWIKTNKRLPRNLSNEPVEKKLGSWLNNRKTIKRKSLSVWSSYYDTYAKELGCPHLFDRVRCTSTNDRIKLVTTICEFIKNNNNKLPNINSTDETESRHARWISNKRVKYNNNKVNQTELNIIESYGYVNLILKNKQHTILDKAEILSDWLKINNRVPKYVDDSNLHSTYTKIIKAYNEKVITDDIMNVFKSNDQMWIFDIKNINVYEYNSNNLCKLVNEYYIKHNKLPTKKDNYELAQWISRKRLALRNIKGGGKLYESDLNLINQFNLYDIIFRK